MGGAGILPTAIINNKLFFLFGKENKYEDSAKGFSDFGGGTDNNETFIQTAIREGTEELTGFLGNENDLKKLLNKHGNFAIDYNCKKYSTYRTHIFPIEYNENLVKYYNNNQQFIQKHLDPRIIKTTKIFEKAEIKWICVDDLKKQRHQFRVFFKNIIDDIILQQKQIKKFISNTSQKRMTNKTLKNRK